MTLNPCNAKSSRGFTLIELLLGIAIIAILAAIALPFYTNYIDRSRTAAFLVQLDAWREKAAVESVASGADLCNWDDSRFGSLRQAIFGTTSTQPFSFSDYQMEVTPRAPATIATGAGQRPFVVDVVATANDGVRALNVAKMIRLELERAGLRYVSPTTDRDLVSMQSFSALLGACGKQQAASVTLPPANVGALVTVVSPGGTQTTPAIPTVSQPLQCAPTEQLNADKSRCVPKTCPVGQALDAKGTCFTPLTCSPREILTPDGKACVPKSCPGGQELDARGTCFTPVTCSPREIQTPDGKACVPKSCPRGQELDARGTCFTPVTCSPREIQTPDGKACVPKSCPRGQELDASGTCFTPVTCSPHEIQTPDGKACVPKGCPRGQKLDANGTCFTPAVCSNGEIQTPDEKGCVPINCPAGMRPNLQGRCAWPLVPANCPRGQELDDGFNCFTPVTCSPLEIRTPDGKACVPKPCPAGMRQNPQGHCVPTHH